MRLPFFSLARTRLSQRYLWCYACLLLLLVGATSSAHAASQAYALQRRIGADGAWHEIASFILIRKTAQSSPQLSSHSEPAYDLTREQKHALTSADLLYYRAIVKSKDHSVNNNNNNKSGVKGTKGNDHVNSFGSHDSMVAAVITTTPCTLIRGFTAVDKETVSLQERVNVVPGDGVSVLGLQLHSVTNFFHSKMTDGDACDRSVVDKLFPRVRMSAEVQLVGLLDVTHPVRYEDLRFFGKNAAKERAEMANKKKTRTTRVTKEDGEIVEEEKVVEEKSFLQKYGIYIVVFVVMSIMRNLKS